MDIAQSAYAPHLKALFKLRLMETGYNCLGQSLTRQRARREPESSLARLADGAQARVDTTQGTISRMTRDARDATYVEKWY